MASNALGVNLTDYAIGGATSGAVPGVLTVPASYTNSSRPTVVEVPSSLEQVMLLPLQIMLARTWPMTSSRPAYTCRVYQHAPACLSTDDILTAAQECTLVWSLKESSTQSFLLMFSSLASALSCTTCLTWHQGQCHMQSLNKLRLLHRSLSTLTSQEAACQTRLCTSFSLEPMTT